MAMELLKSLAHLDIKHVPYRAGNVAVNDLIGGHVDMFVGSLPQMIELVRADHATGHRGDQPATRSSLVPELPTLAEAGVPGYELEQWWGIVVPAGTPRNIIDALNAELNRILATPEISGFHGARRRRANTIDSGGVWSPSLSASCSAGANLVERIGLKVP